MGWHVLLSEGRGEKKRILGGNKGCSGFLNSLLLLLRFLFGSFSSLDPSGDRDRYVKRKRKQTLLSKNLGRVIPSSLA